MSDIKTGDIKTGDTKPKRGAREPVHGHTAHGHAAIGHSTIGEATISEATIGEAVVAEAVAAATEAVIERNVMPEPEPVSTIAVAQAMRLGPACPVPAAPEIAPVEKPSVSDKSPQAAAETAWTAFAEAQSALSRGFEKAAFEMTGISRSGMVAAADAAVALLGARTLAEAVEINAGLARRNLDTMFEASARLSEIGAQAVADASRPVLARYGRGWSDARGWGALGTS